MTIDRAEANRDAFKRITEAQPYLVDVRKAIDVVPGLTRDMVLISGPELPWSEVDGIQRLAVVNAVVHEGLADTTEAAEAMLDRGEIKVEPTQDHDCVGISTGIYTASMPVYVLENRNAGNRAFCHILEGNPPRLFVNGAYADDVVERLRFIEDVFAPVLGEALRRAGGLAVKPLMRRAISMGDELHTRCDAGTQLYIGALVPLLLELAREREEEVRQIFHLLQSTPFSFLRVAAPAAKSMVDAAKGVEGSSLVTAMVLNGKAFGIRVSGLGDQWFRGPHPEFFGKYFYGSSAEDIGWGGGESSFMETFGLGGFAQVAAFALPFRGSVESMVERNLEMYDITVGVHAELKIPYFERGVPAGIDVMKVVETGIRPVINGAVIRKDGEGLAGVGPMVADMEPFQAAVAAYKERYG